MPRGAPGLIALLLVTLAGCDDGATPRAAPHPRIVCLSPALGQMLFDMQLSDHVVGISKFTQMPDGIERPVVGDYLDISVEAILELQPDVIVVQGELRQMDSLRLAVPDARIESFSIETFDDIAESLARLGAIADRPSRGEAAASEFRSRLAKLRDAADRGRRRSMIFVIGYQQPLGAGRGTFLDEMIRLVGGRNALADRIVGWKPPGLEAIVDAAPDVIMCQVTPGQEAPARAYWRKLGGKRFPQEVILLTEPNWTIPGTHLADRAESLRRRLATAQTARKASRP